MINIIDFIKNIYAMFFFSLFRIIPLQKKVVFSCFSGRKYADNPKIISASLYYNKAIKQVWIYRSQKFEDIPKDIVQVKWGSVGMIYHLATSRVWVDSHPKPLWAQKRKNQFYINTWHGGLGIKKIEGDIKDKLSSYAIKRIKHNSSMVDLFISNSDWLTSIYRRAFWYNGTILKLGYPKTDYLLNPPYDVKKKVYNTLGISYDIKTLLYAPTMRDNPVKELFDLGWDSTIKALEKKFGGKWIILLKMHPVNNSFVNELNINDNVIDVTEYPDILELTVGCDFFISDYSSGIFDAAIINKMAVIFALDESEYSQERGLYVELNDLPFPVARTNKELYNIICNFDEKKYYDNVNAYFDKVGFYDDGNATKKIIDLIEKKMR